MASVAAARSTQSSFPAFVARTNPSDLGVVDLRAASGGGGASIVPTLAGLAAREAVASLNVANSLTVRPDGHSHGRECETLKSGVFTVVSAERIASRNRTA